MSIPNVPTLYQKIGSGAEGGHEFSRVVRKLLFADFHQQGIDFNSESDASGDFKRLDGFVKGDEDFPDNLIGFHFKFFPSNPSPSQRNLITKCIDAAIFENPYMEKLILITPEDFKKEGAVWFETIFQRYKETNWLESNGLVRKNHFHIVHWGHTKIVELMLKHSHIGIQYYPNLFSGSVGQLKLSSLLVDSYKSYWVINDSQPNSYFLVSPKKGDVLDRISDPVFDVTFKNSSSEVYLLKKIEIHIERVWTVLRGLPKETFLKSVGVFEIDMDFSKQINSVNFDDPLIFYAQMPQRFHLRLKEFVSKWPGNCAQIKLWFYFDELTIPSDTIFLYR